MKTIKTDYIIQLQLEHSKIWVEDYVYSGRTTFTEFEEALTYFNGPMIKLPGEKYRIIERVTEITEREMDFIQVND